MEEKELLALSKAIFASGFYIGLRSGKDSVACFEFGTRSYEPQTVEKAWKEYIDSKLKTGKDIKTVDFWENILSIFEKKIINLKEKWNEKFF